MSAFDPAGLVRAHKYDLVIASQLSMAAYQPYFRGVPALFEEAEIGLSYGDAHHAADVRKRLRHAFTWFKLRMYLSRLLGAFRACTVASEQERQLFARNFSTLSRSVEVIPNCVQVSEYEGRLSSPERNQLIFSGSFRYRANYEAMLWFVRDVFPLVLERFPDAHLVITGDHADLPFPSRPEVTLAGHVEDIKSLTASSRASIAPLLSGGGTRLKILEAMAMGVPVVSTSKGAEGLDAVPGEHLLVADLPEDFAACVVNVLKDDPLRDRLAANGHLLVKQKYNWETVLPRFMQLAESCAG